jgi:hypothetical protein
MNEIKNAHKPIIHIGDLQTSINKKNYKPPIAFVRVLFKNKDTEPFSVLEACWKEGILLWEHLALTFLTIDTFKDCYCVEIFDSSLEKQLIRYRD